MAKKNFYAVRVGRQTGIFNTWDECKAQTYQFPGAKFSGFETFEEAEAFLNGDAPLKAPKKTLTAAEKSQSALEEVALTKELSKDSNIVVVYTDGSNTDQGPDGEKLDYFRYSYGFLVITDGAITFEDNGEGKSKDASNMRNVAGELLGAMKAAIYTVNVAKKPKVIIFHDYEGVSKWVKGEWKAKNQLVQQYVQFMKDCQSKIEIDFVKVSGHIGNPYNERADQLARLALGLEIR